MLILALYVTYSCFAIDADTLQCSNFRVRVAGIDAPESYRPKCEAERELAARAKAFTVEFVSAPVGIEPLRIQNDPYGRILAHVRRDGRDLGAELVERGMARVWDGARRSWCNGEKQ
jgi:micrococcal nuclease